MRDSGSSISPATIATAITGTFTRNAACQLNASSSSPPRIGPSAAPRAAIADQIPSAVARSLGSVNRVRIMDSVDGMIIAPPTPSSALSATRAAGSFAHTTATDAAPNSAKPLISIFLRPQRSPRALIVTSSPETASE